MTDAIQKLPDDSANTGKALDLNQTTNGGGATVYQQRIVVANTPAVTDVATASIDAKIPAQVAGGLPVSLVSAGPIATAAKQDTGNTSLASIDSKTPALSGGAVPVVNATGATAANQATEIASLASIDSKTPALSGGAVPVVNATGATATKQDTGNTSLASIDSKLPALSGGAIPVTQASQVTTQTDKSGTITAGGTAQVLAAANASRKGWWIFNSSSGDLWVNDVGTATAGGSSLKVVSGALYESPARTSPNAISLFGATTGQAFAAREF